MPLDRREFLKVSAASLGALSALRCGDAPEADKVAPPEPEPDDGAALVELDPAAIAIDETAFPRGVQAGAMTSTSAILWTYSADPAEKLLRVWRDAESPGRVKLVKELSVVPAEGFIKTAVSGLGPGYYRYAFFDPANARRGRIGRFRTAFGEGDLRPLVIAGLACTNLEKRPYEALDATALLEADLICHLGDMSYNDDAVTLADYRGRWRETLEEPGYRAAYASSGLYATWDDHEFAGDFNPERWAFEQPERLAAAKQAYFETTAVEGERLWRSYRWGATAEIFVLDCRSERRPSTRESEAPIYIGEEQLAWLKSALAASPCHFKILLNSVPITRLGNLWEVAQNDRWQGYERQRADLLDSMTSQNIQNVYFLSGDFHCSYAARLEAEGPARNYWELLVGPTSPRGPNPLAILADSGDLPREDVFPASQFLFGSGNRYATTRLVFDPLNRRVEGRWVASRYDTKGQVLFEGRIG